MSRTQSSSFPGGAPSTPRSNFPSGRDSSASTILDLLMQGIGYREAATLTASPGPSTCDTCPSKEILAAERLRSETRKDRTDDDGKTSGRNDKLRGHIGVRTRALSEGCTMGPPADREYAVDPVGVETMMPSD